MKLRTRTELRTRRHTRVRRKVKGTPERPRLAIMVSNRYMYAQVIDDENGVTLAAATTQGDAVANSVATASSLGKKIAGQALEKGIQTVVFDRGGYRYHGRVKAIADGAREAGLKV